MILRKPYAFLIKNFRLIHLFMSIIMGYLVIKTSFVLSFYNNYVGGEQLIKGYDISKQIFTLWMFLWPLFIIAASISIIALLYKQKKPLRLYVANVAIYASIFILFFIALNFVNELETRLIDVRVIRAVRDFLTAAFFMQTIGVALMFVRATGFDIKQFNFQADIDKLNVSEEDKEEFELALSFDSDSLMRDLRRFFKNIKYTYLENQYISNLVLATGVLLVSLYSIVNFFIFNKSYQEQKQFSLTNITMQVNRSYVTKNDYNNEVIKQNTKLVVAEVNFKNNYDYKMRVDVSSMILEVGRRQYHPINDYDKQIQDLGNPYRNNYITKEGSTYLLVYQVPEDLSLKSAKLNIKEVLNEGTSKLVNKYYRVKLNPQDLDSNIKTTEYALGEEIDFAGSILGNSKIKLDEYSIMPSFAIQYQFCIAKDDCMDSFETIKPSFYNLDDNVILKLKGSTKIDDNYEGIMLSSVYSLINNFAKIEYTRADNNLVQNNGFVQVKANKVKQINTEYIEIDKNILGADNLRLVFKLRNREYVYKLPSILE